MRWAYLSWVVVLIFAHDTIRSSQTLTRRNEPPTWPCRPRTEGSFAGGEHSHWCKTEPVTPQKNPWRKICSESLIQIRGNQTSWREPYRHGCDIISTLCWAVGRVRAAYLLRQLKMIGGYGSWKLTLTRLNLVWSPQDRLRLHPIHIFLTPTDRDIQKLHPSSWQLCGPWCKRLEYQVSVPTLTSPQMQARTNGCGT